MSIKWHWIPNLLSISRIPLGLAFVLLYQPHSPKLFILAIPVVGVALLTDIADGKIARRYGYTTKLGYMLDGLGDKAFYVAFLLVIQREAPMTSPLCWLLIIREIAMYALRVVSKNIESELIRLRVYSLLHAFWIRSWFLAVMAHDAFNIAGYEVEWLPSVGLACGCLAALSGVAGLIKQARFMHG